MAPPLNRLSHTARLGLYPSYAGAEAEAKAIRLPGAAPQPKRPSRAGRPRGKISSTVELLA